MKSTLFDNLDKLKASIMSLNNGDRENGKKILIEVDEITNQFNKGKYATGVKELDLNPNELQLLKTKIEEIWNEARNKNIEVWPIPDIVTKVG